MASHRGRDERVPSGSRIQRTAGDDSAQQHHSLLPPSTLTTTVAMTREEVSTLRAKLGRNLVHSIRTNALHGGRRVPKSTVVECGVSLDVARAIMTIDGDGINDGGVVRMVGDTKRLVRWMVENDAGIMRALGRDERLVHPVRHDGTGIYIFSSSSVVRAASAASASRLPQSSDSSLSPSPESSSATNGGNGTIQNNANAMYHWARFVSLEAKYDKREMTLKYTAKTVAAGSGRPEKVPEIVRYSRGEREDYPLQ